MVIDDDLLIMFKLSKAGYGSISQIEKWDARKVIQALNYEKFISDYESAYIEINK